MTQKFRNRFLPMLVAILVIAATSTPLLFLSEDPSTRWLVYPLAAFRGIGLAIMLNTSTSLISDVIGSDTENSAFVYGWFSFSEKVVNGVLLWYIIAEHSACPNSLKWINAFVPTACAFAAYVLTWIGNRYYSEKM